MHQLPDDDDDDDDDDNRNNLHNMSYELRFKLAGVSTSANEVG